MFESINFSGDGDNFCFSCGVGLMNDPSARVRFFTLDSYLKLHCNFDRGGTRKIRNLWCLYCRSLYIEEKCKPHSNEVQNDQNTIYFSVRFEKFIGRIYFVFKGSIFTLAFT